MFPSIHRKAWNEIRHLFHRHGSTDYIGEQVSQLSHAIQSARLARHLDHANHHFITAALLHDVGQLVALEKWPLVSRSSIGVRNHEYMGYHYVKQLSLHPLVCDLVRDHVLCKRYLVSTNPLYYEWLSCASRKTLYRHQGGLLTNNQIQQFQKQPHFLLSTVLRHIDDLAKDPEIVNGQSDLDTFEENFLQSVSLPTSSADK